MQTDWITAILDCNPDDLKFFDKCKYSPTNIIKKMHTSVNFENIIDCIFDIVLTEIDDAFYDFIEEIGEQINNFYDDQKFIEKAKLKGLVDEEKYNKMKAENEKEGERLNTIKANLDNMDVESDFKLDMLTTQTPKIFCQSQYYKEYFKETLEKIQKESGLEIIWV